YMLDVTNPNLELDISLSQRSRPLRTIWYPWACCWSRWSPTESTELTGLDFCQVVHHTACSSAQRITLGLHLEPGRYILLPCTEIASQEAFFTLRIYSRGASELVADQPPASLCFAFTAYPEVGTRVLVLSARGLPASSLAPTLIVFFEAAAVQGSNPGPRQHVRSGMERAASVLPPHRPASDRIRNPVRSNELWSTRFWRTAKSTRTSGSKAGTACRSCRLYGHRQVSGAGSPMRPNKTERVRLAAKLFVQIFSTNDLLSVFSSMKSASRACATRTSASRRTAGAAGRGRSGTRFPHGRGNRAPAATHFFFPWPSQPEQATLLATRALQYCPLALAAALAAAQGTADLCTSDRPDSQPESSDGTVSACSRCRHHRLLVLILEGPGLASTRPPRALWPAVLRPSILIIEWLECHSRYSGLP
uniref:Calpain_III domain-containing protein n=1 Tax=Macrostomum lignano TaxID=282301 RepID=A0A1I8FKF9_9PLAT